MTTDVKFNIKEINLVGIRVPACINTHCDLCKNHLSVLSERDNGQNLESDIVIGRCKHGFHSKCISLWQQQGSTICPIDKTEWKPLMLQNVAPQKSMFAKRAQKIMT